MPREVHPDIKAAVLAWARAADLEHAATALAEARLALDPELLPTLRSEIAEISAETMIEVLAMEAGVEPGPTIEVLGLPLLQKQAERLGAWISDQPATARALGVELEAWGRMVEAGMQRYLESARGSSKAQGIDRDSAERFLGQARTSAFVAPAPTGPRGVLSLISATKFPKKPS